MDSTPRASFERTLAEEQVTLTVRSPTRWGLAAVWLSIAFLTRWLDDGPVVRAMLPLAVLYAAYAVGMAIMMRLVAHPLRLLYAVPLIDVPFAGVTCLTWARIPGQLAEWPCGMSLGLCGCMILVAARLLHTRVLIATTASALAIVLALFTYLHQPPVRVVYSLFIIAAFGFVGRMTVRHSVTLVRRGWELAEARVSEISSLNEELRRQVAERSRELTEMLARSEGTVAPIVLEIGDVFDGRYRLTRALGRGGMGAVYEVERMRDARMLALKVVTGALHAKQAARFAREAEIGARVQHENLVSIVDVGIAAGATPFLVMELVQGGSLEDKRPRFGDAAWARPILRQIAAGLTALHAKRIVHRDLKPGNVLLVENGGVDAPLAKISDFGISRFGALDDGGDVDVETATLSPAGHSPGPHDLTETGALMGTPVYMPPEAWFGPARHPSADVFSFGVLAYEALSGRSPFAVPPVVLVRSRQIIPAPAPLDGIEASVAELVLACLRLDPPERPRASELADRL